MTHKLPGMQPTSVGSLLKEILLENGITIEELAEQMNVSARLVDKLIADKCKVGNHAAHLLAEALNTTPQMWLNIQRAWDEWELKDGNA